MGTDEVAAPSVHALGDRLPQRTLRREAVLELAGTWVRSFDEDKQAAPGSHSRNERRKRVAPEVGVYRDRVARKIAVAQKCLGVGGRGRADIAALTVGARNKAGRPSKPGPFDEAPNPAAATRLQK